MERLVGKGLSFDYGGNPVLQRVHLCVTPGVATLLVGPSGSGKTTLLWLLAGLLTPSAGEVGLGEVDARPELLRPTDRRRFHIGMVFQQPALWDHLTAEAHLQLVLAGRGLSRADRRGRIDRTLRQMRLRRLAKRRPGQLSGGERQRLAVARALVVEPRWLLLDEPLAHLDGPVRTDLFELLRGAIADAKAGAIMATHNATEAMRLADEVVILLAGRVAQSGPAEQVYRQPVSLAAARVLGPAAEVRGEANDGVLVWNAAPVVENLDPSQSGPTQMILRPEDVEFGPDRGGPAVAVACEFAAGAYQLRVEAAGVELLACCRESISPGTRGRLRLRRAL